MERFPWFPRRNYDTQGYFFPPESISPEVQTLSRAIARVYDEGESIGSGFILRIGKGLYFVSAAHCFEEKERTIILSEGIKLACKVQETAAHQKFIELDLFIVELKDFWNIEGLELSTCSPSAFRIDDFDTQVMAIGYPDSYLCSHAYQDPLVSMGIIRNYSDTNRIITTTARTEPGSSGSPLLDGMGKVLGVVIRSSHQYQYDKYRNPAAERQFFQDSHAVFIADLFGLLPQVRRKS